MVGLAVGSFQMTKSFMSSELLFAYKVATDSPDPSTQCGACVYTEDGLFLAAACNDFTKGVRPSAERLERPLKYSFIEHAERGAIFASCFMSESPRIMVAPWAACTECARAIVQSGIHTLVRHKQASDRSPKRWVESIGFADKLLADGGVEVLDFDGFLDGPEIRHCEERWVP